jgi:hypothetical protein
LKHASGEVAAGGVIELRGKQRADASGEHPVNERSE